MNDTTICPGQKCLDNGLPLEVHTAIAVILGHLSKALAPDQKPLGWTSLEISGQTLPEEVLPNAHIFNFGVHPEAYPFNGYFFPNYFKIEDFAKLIEAPDPENFFQPLEMVDINNVIGMAYVAHGGPTANLDATIGLSTGTLSLVTQLPGIKAMWHGYDMPGARYAIALEIHERRWMFVINYRDIRNAGVARKLQ